PVLQPADGRLARAFLPLELAVFIRDDGPDLPADPVARSRQHQAVAPGVLEMAVQGGQIDPVLRGDRLAVEAEPRQAELRVEAPVRARPAGHRHPLLYQPDLP